MCFTCIYDKFYKYTFINDDYDNGDFTHCFILDKEPQKITKNHEES